MPVDPTLTEGRPLSTIERRTGHRPAAYSVSRDGRLARDWVPQYTDIIAEHYLPTHWPRLITVDSFDVRVKTFDAQGNPVQKGKHLYSVFAAVGHGPGNHRGQLWHVAAFAGESEREFREFFRQLEGQPEIVVCDGSWAIRTAAAWAFPENGGVPVRLAPLQPAARAQCAVPGSSRPARPAGRGGVDPVSRYLRD
jgi:hypothetical protein